MSEPSFEDLYQHAPCGYLTIDADGRIAVVNETFLALGGWQRSAVEGQLLRDLLDTGSQIFYETRHLPILKLSGSVREVALTLRVADGGTLPVLVNAVAADEGVRFAVFDSTVRGQYERELVAAKRAAEASEARVRALQDAATTFGLGTVEASLTQTLADTVRIAVSAMSSAVMLVDGTGPLTLAAGSNPLLADFPPDAARPSTKAFQTASVVIISSVFWLGSLIAGDSNMAYDIHNSNLEPHTGVPFSIDPTHTVNIPRSDEKMGGGRWDCKVRQNS